MAVLSEYLLSGRDGSGAQIDSVKWAFVFGFFLKKKGKGKIDNRAQYSHNSELYTLQYQAVQRSRFFLL